MDKRFFFAFLLLVASAQMALAQSVTVKMKGEKTVVYNLSEVADITFSETDYHECEYVDLGLPSGTLWATCNIGAETPEEYGSYFAWGETQPKESFSWFNYKYCLDGKYYNITKYNCDEGSGFQDYLGSLNPEDDAAIARWGTEWQMPGMSEFYELYDEEYTQTSFTTRNGVGGLLVTSKLNSKSIFLPAAGLYDNEGLNNDGRYGYYWSSELDGSASYLACSMNFYSGGTYTGTDNRYYGMSIRPIRAEKAERVAHKWIDLGLPSGTLWATMNVGANSLEEYGSLFRWGETVPTDDYSWSTYFDTDDNGSTFKKYNSNGGLTELLPEDDAATVNWGVEWQTPNWAQCHELMSDAYTTKEVFLVNDTRVNKITSLINGNYILLPPGDWFNASSGRYDIDCGFYWSRTLASEESYKAFAMFFDMRTLMSASPWRNYGIFVRPVHKLNKEIVPVTDILLSETSLELEVGDKVQLTPTIVPSNATFPAVVWDSDGVVYVSPTGEVSAYRAGTATITCQSTDNPALKVSCQVTVRARPEFVDLGLPSGTLWATCNVGANSPEEYGDYFAWGETEPKDNYTWRRYFDTNDKGRTFFMYYFNGGETELLSGYDAATANRGSEWETPSISQISELCNSSNTTTEWTQVNGVNGRKITSNSNGNSIFLPAAGYRHGTSCNNAGALGMYWSRSLSGDLDNSEKAYSLWFDSLNIDDGWGSRYFGFSVRPVRKILASAIVLDKTQLNLDADKGQTAQLTATVQPANFVSNKKVTWESSDNYVASVDQTGLVKAIAPGTCTITCRAKDGSGVKAECYVIVGGTSGGGGDWD
ncbi:MAG: Ig-like domain-containing protein [Bacteroidaceae bacterium]|nr:Ig-like domain-containing protein [Bacteroidaceae bacterium]